jgi:Predicted nucleotidyltransferases
MSDQTFSKVAEKLNALSPVLDALRHGMGDDLVAVVLFGSQARGEADPQSDWDLLVIACNLPPKALARHFYLKSMLPADWRARISLLAKTPQEFESRLPPLYLDIALDGIVLFDREEYMTRRLEWIRQQIQRHHLQRLRFDRDLMWYGASPISAPGWEGFA